MNVWIFFFLSLFILKDEQYSMLVDRRTAASHNKLREHHFFFFDPFEIPD